MDPIYCGFLHPQKAGWAWADFIASHPLENGLFINKTHCHYLKSGKEPLSQKVLSHSCVIASFSLPGGPNTAVVHAYTTSHGKTIFLIFFLEIKGEGQQSPTETLKQRELCQQMQQHWRRGKGTSIFHAAAIIYSSDEGRKNLQVKTARCIFSTPCEPELVTKSPWSFTPRFCLVLW